MYNIGIKDVYTDSESESSNDIDTGTNVYIYIYIYIYIYTPYSEVWRIWRICQTKTIQISTYVHLIIYWLIH